MRWSKGTLVIFSLVVALFAACGEEPTPSTGEYIVPTPQIDSLSVYSAAVGEPVQFLGQGFIDPEEGYTTITFRGDFYTEYGSEPVNFTVRGEYQDEFTLIWNRFGPYQVPFTRAGNHLGTFTGEVFATNYTKEDAEEGTPVREQQQTAQRHSFDFEVEPSLVIREVIAAGEEFEASCNFLGTRFINFIPYRMTVEAVGFDPDEFTYTVSEGSLDADDNVTTTIPQTITHMATASLDSLGDIEPLRFAEVPLGSPIYRSSISVDATSTTGEHFQQFLMVTVHQPLAVRILGGVEEAEYMEPIPVSGCIPGGPQGRNLTYSETETETRTVSETQSLTAGWTNTYTDQHMSSYGEGGAEANQIGFSSSDQTNWNWNVHGEVMVGAEGGFGPFAKAKGEVRVGGGVGGGGAHTDTQSGQQSWTQTSTFTEAVTHTESNSESIQEAITNQWTMSSSHSEMLAYQAYLLPNHFGVFYRQTIRMIHRGEVLAMDLCGNQTVVGEFMVNTYTWAPDMAMGLECPPMPESGLPEAQCLIPPCEGVY